jgi:hypothetical protein
MNDYEIIDSINKTNYLFNYIKKINNSDFYLYKYEVSEIIIILFFDNEWKIKYYSEVNKKIIIVDLSECDNLNINFINSKFNNYESLNKDSLYFLSILDNYNQLSYFNVNRLYYLYQVDKNTNLINLSILENIKQKDLLIISSSFNCIEDILNENNYMDSYICTVVENNKYINIYNIVNNEMKNLLFFDREYNIYDKYIELYNNNQFKKYGRYICEYYEKTYELIDISISSISREILNIYHLTRNKKNPNLYNKLLKIYKKILYEIHNIYIYMKKNDSDDNIKKVAININNIINYIKELSPNDIKNLLIEREIIINSLDDKKDNIFEINNNDVILLTQVIK